MEVNESFSENYIYQVPNVDQNSNLTITYTCGNNVKAGSVPILRYVSTDVASHSDVYRVPKYVYKNCPGKFGFSQKSSALTASAAVKFMTLASGSGVVSTVFTEGTTAFSPSPSPSSSGSDNNLLYLLLLLLLIPLLIGLFICWKLSKRHKKADAARDGDFEREPLPALRGYDIEYPVLDLDQPLPPVINSAPNSARMGTGARIPQPTPAATPNVSYASSPAKQKEVKEIAEAVSTNTFV